MLQIVRDGKFIQLSMTLSRMDNRVVQGAICRECNIEQLLQKLTQLVAKLVEADKISTLSPVVSAQPAAEEPPPAIEAVEEGTGGAGTAGWIGWGLGLVAAIEYYQAYSLLSQAQDNYDKAEQNQSASLYSEAEGQEEEAASALQLAGIATAGALITWIVSASLDDDPAAAQTRWGIMPTAGRSGALRPMLYVFHKW